MPKCNYFFFCFILAYTTVLAQPKINFNIQEFTTENGLPSNGIKGIQWDEHTGFLWLGTEAGIVRFDGVRFKNFTKENTPIITTERMLFMTRNQNGKIYTADQGNNVLSIHQNTLREEKAAYMKTQANTGSLSYLLVSDTFFQYFRQKEDKFRFDVFFDLALAINDTALIAIRSGKIFYKSFHNNLIITPPQKELSFVSNFKINKESFVVASNNNIYKLNPENLSLELVPIFNSRPTRSYQLGIKNHFFQNYTQRNAILIDGESAFELDFSNNKIVMQLICNNVPKDVLIHYAQYSAIKKMFFLGTNSKGLIVLTENKVSIIKKANLTSNERNAYYNQIELEDGSILTNEGHVVNTNRKKEQQKDLPIKGKFNFSLSITKDSLLWYSQQYKPTGYNSLHQKNLRTGSLKVFEKIRANEF